MDQAVRNVVDWTGAGIADACRMASAVPARILGLATKGRLVVGADADLVLLDQSLRVRATFRGGECLFSREGLDVPAGNVDA
jgi:N-acetylglucosamine-6-phosphate deacetylase